MNERLKIQGHISFIQNKSFSLTLYAIESRTLSYLTRIYVDGFNSDFVFPFWLIHLSEDKFGKIHEIQDAPFANWSRIFEDIVGNNTNS